MQPAAMSSSLWLVGVAGRRGTAVDRLRVTLCCCLAIWALSWRAAWEVPNFVSGRPLPQQPCAAIALAASNEDEDTTTLWKEALEVERARSQLLLEQLDELKEAVAATRIGEEMIAAKALYEECAVKWGQDEYEQLKGCNDRLQQAIKSLQATSSPSPAPPSGPSATGRLEGIGVAVEVLPPVGRSDEIALVAGAPHVRVSLPPLELQQLPQLSQLSLEDNHIDALDTFARLQSLAELYLSNNLLEDVRSVLLLKQLPKLLILDLAGNELRSATEYREYTIFHLRRLKVLDGLPITQADHHGADEKFSGKVTMELLEEKLGPSSPCYTLRVVDLSNQSIRELGSLINDEIFPCLRELTLDGNPFASISNLGPLSKLTVLRMNRSRIDLEKGLLTTSGQEPRGATALPQLQVLEMGYCGISDLAPLAQVPLPNLRILHLPGNEIARVEGLSGFEQLRELVLDKNRIRQFEEQSFAGLKSLRELRLEDNALKSLSNLGPLPRLRALYLSFNRVAELVELEKLRNLKHVLLLNMASNPVARKPLFRAHIVHALGSVRAIDGREVTMDEREKVAQLLQVTDPSKQTGSMLYYMEQQPAALTGVAPQPGQPLIPGPGLLGPQPEIVSEGAPRRQAEPGDAHRRGPTARSHSVPRHMSLEHRIGQLPPGSGR